MDDDWKPDTPLADPQHEQWVQCMLTGMGKEETYRRTGISITALRKGNPRRQRMELRLRHLMSQAAEQAEITASWWLREVYGIATSAVTDIIEFIRSPDSNSADTVLVRDSRDLPRHTRQAIKKIKIKTNSMTGETQYELEMYDRLRALQMLGDYLGMNTPENIKTIDVVAEEFRETEGRTLSNEDLQKIREIAWKK